MSAISVMLPNVIHAYDLLYTILAIAGVLPATKTLYQKNKKNDYRNLM